MAVKYDYIIVGAGPAGLTLAYLLSKNSKCLLIDKQKSLGGCHSVRRDENNLFSEHGPRVYSSTYKTLGSLLQSMGTSFDKIFTPYKFNVSKIGQKTISHIKFHEKLKLAVAYFWSAFSDYYANVKMSDFTADFSIETKDYLDRLCRLTDGAGLDNYSVLKFINLINQNFGYTFYQPRLPNDEGLFAVWRDALVKQNVEIMLNSEVTKVNHNNGIATGVVVNGNEISGNKIILAIPPKPLLNVLKNSFINNTFATSFENWVEKNSYVDYITITYSWDKKIPLKTVWGFPSTSWGVASMVLSDYFENSDNLIISVGVTNVDKIGSNGLTARNSNDSQLISETFNQLKEVYPDLPLYDHAIIGSRINQETAYIKSPGSPYIPFTGKIKNLYNVGTQNGKALYSFTSMESAVVNAVSLAHTLDESTKMQKIINPWTLNQRIVLILVLILVLSFTIYYVEHILNQQHQRIQDHNVQ